MEKSKSNKVTVAQIKRATKTAGKRMYLSVNLQN